MLYIIHGNLHETKGSILQCFLVFCKVPGSMGRKQKQELQAGPSDHCDTMIIRSKIQV